MITLTRHSSYGVMFDPSGAVLIGYNCRQAVILIILSVYGYSGQGALKVYQNASYSSPAVSVQVHNSVNAYESGGSSGARNFYVTGGGIVYSNGVQLTSDISLKKDIETISNPLEKVLQLRGVTFQMNFPQIKGTGEEKELSEEEAYQLIKARTPEITPEIFKQIQEEKSRNEMGVIAQEVEKIVPEVVRTREDGLKSVAYTELTGLLIEAIKELKAEVDELKGNNFLRTATNETETTGVDPVIAQCKLYQNSPNPFNQNTQIKFYIAENVKTAQLCIYNLQGMQIKQILVTERGESSQWISGSELSAGMYFYALIADGKEVDTKRMILTK